MSKTLSLVPPCQHFPLTQMSILALSQLWLSESEQSDMPFHSQTFHTGQGFRIKARLSRLGPAVPFKDMLFLRTFPQFDITFDNIQKWPSGLWCRYDPCCCYEVINERPIRQRNIVSLSISSTLDLGSYLCAVLCVLPPPVSRIPPWLWVSSHHPATCPMREWVHNTVPCDGPVSASSPVFLVRKGPWNSCVHMCKSVFLVLRMYPLFTAFLFLKKNPFRLIIPSESFPVENSVLLRAHETSHSTTFDWIVPWQCHGLCFLACWRVLNGWGPAVPAGPPCLLR